MKQVYAKPKLVFFQYKYVEQLSEFLLMHKREHAQCISLFFDVTAIQRRCAAFMSAYTSLSAIDILVLCAMRWAIEVYLKEVKQHLGFMKEQSNHYFEE
jgi:hypothetical protein